MTQAERHQAALLKFLSRYYFLYGLNDFWFSSGRLPKVLPTTVEILSRPYPTDPDIHVLIHRVGILSDGGFYDNMFRFTPTVKPGASLGTVLAEYAFTFDSYEMKCPDIEDVIIADAHTVTEGFDRETLLRRFNYCNLKMIISRPRLALRKVLEHFRAKQTSA